MSTFEEVIEAAARQLDNRGLLLDLHVSQLAGGDKSLVDLVRKSLTAAGVAEDRFGMGLARVGKAGVCVAAWRDGRLQPADGNILTAEPEPAVSEQEVADWWLMSKGSVRGPWSMSHLIAMQQSQQLSLADLVRQGSRGPWLSPNQVAELAEAAPGLPPVVEVPSLPATLEPTSPLRPGTEWKPLPGSQQQAAPKRAEQVDCDPLPPRKHPIAAHERRSDPDTTMKPATVSSGSSPNVAQITALANSIGVEPFKSNSALQTRSGNQVLTRPLFRSGIEAFVGIIVSPFAIIGGRLLGDVRKLVSRLLVPISGVAVVLALWWFWPPSSAGILREFEASRQQVEALKRSKMSNDQLVEALRPIRRRVLSLVRVLEGRATDQPSIHRELLLAGKHGLLVVLDHPQRSEMFEEMYALHARQARMLLDGVAPETAIQEAPARSRRGITAADPVLPPTSDDAPE